MSAQAPAENPKPSEQPVKSKRGRRRTSVREKLPVNLGTVRELAALGVQRNQLAKILGIARSSLYNYMQDEEFFGHLKKGEAHALMVVEKSLFARCVGYTMPEVTMERDGSGKLHVVKVVEKHLAPDPTCLIYYTHNRDPKRWPNRQQQDLSVGGRLLIQELDGIAPDELLELAKRLSASVTKKVLENAG